MNEKEINIYLAGPMTNMPDYNYQTFLNTAKNLKYLTGCHIVHTANAPRGWTHDEYLDHSIRMLMFCDAVYVMPNSDNSKGVKKEIEVASVYGIPVFFDIDEVHGWLEGRDHE